jgi:hypothetical protein
MRTALRPTASLRPTALVGLAILGSDWCNITAHLTLAGLLVRLLTLLIVLLLAAALLLLLLLIGLLLTAAALLPTLAALLSLLIALVRHQFNSFDRTKDNPSFGPNVPT